MLEADALYLHLNPLQEAVQPEGDTCFAGLADRIGAIARALPVPVIGQGSRRGPLRGRRATAAAARVRIFDVAGSGGTSWSRIEHHRQIGTRKNDLGLLFQDWGLPTPRALWELRGCRPDATLIASGGLRSGLDMAKAIILGASLCGVAAPFLKPAMTSTRAVIQEIERLRREFRTAQFLLGAARVEALHANPSLLASPPDGL